jgi:branched-chain amino acid transport system permease protein
VDAFFDLLRPIGLNQTDFQFMLVAAVLGVSIYMTLYGGMFSLANAGFMAIGAYVSVILTQSHDWPFLPAILMGMLAAGLIALPVGLTVLRLHDIYLAIATIGFGEIVRVLILNTDRIQKEVFVDGLGWADEPATITGGATGIKGVPVITTTEYLLIFVALLAYFLYRMHRSRFGRALKAIRQDEKVAEGLGIHVVYYKNMAFIIGAIIAGGAGGLSGHLTRIITPGAYGFNQAVDILAYAVLGGTNTLIGPIVGGMALEYIDPALRRLDVFTWLSDLTGVDLTQDRGQILGALNGVILLLVILYLPGGISDPGMWKGLYRRLKRIFSRGGA